MLKTSIVVDDAQMFQSVFSAVLLSFFLAGACKGDEADKIRTIKEYDKNNKCLVSFSVKLLL